MILIENGLVYDHEGDTDRPARLDILIDGKKIVRVAPSLRRAFEKSPQDVVSPDTVTIDAENLLVVPGFVNAHYHSHDTLLKGFFETIPLELWGQLALPSALPRRSKQELRARTLIGAIECLRGGMTTVQDMSRIHPLTEEDMDVVLKAYDEVGIRCIFALHLSERSILESAAFWKDIIPQEHRWRLASPLGPLLPPGSDMAETVLKLIRSRKDRYPRITFGVGPSEPERLHRSTFEAIADMARREQLPLYTHVNLTRSVTVSGRLQLKDFDGSFVKYLEACGALGPRSSLAHSVWLTEKDIELFANTGTTAAFNPISGLKTRSGVAPYRACIDAGVNIGLGCDNCSCSDAQNMFQAMKMFCTLAAVSDPMPGPPFASDALRAACLGAARPAGLIGRIGEIKEGYLADLVLIDLRDPSFVPLNSAARQLVFTEAGRGVHTVIVDGKIVVDDGKITTVNEVALRDEIRELMVQVVYDTSQVSDRVAPIKDAILEVVRRSWEYDLDIHRYLGGRK